MKARTKSPPQSPEQEPQNLKQPSDMAAFLDQFPVEVLEAVLEILKTKNRKSHYSQLGR
jgi:hypothetical protein